jgi:hypothetical protein
VAIGAYLGGKDGFERAVAEFAALYADKNDRDHAELERARKMGRITVTAGV